jgi:hypothetical protein
MFKMPHYALLLVIIGIGVILLSLSGFREGFRAGMPGIRCGVDLPTCSLGLQCMNGFCEKALAPALLKNELPVYP